MKLTYRYRVKNLEGELNRQARAVNFVWNYCNDVQRQALKWGGHWPSGFDLINLTTGSSKELRLYSDTIAQVCLAFAARRIQHGPCLRWRGKRSLGWIPVRAANIKSSADGFRFNGKTYRVFNSRPLPSGKIRDGSNFAQDARGNWFLNIVIETEVATPREAQRAVGIDLGLKDLAVMSNGERVENPRHLSGIAKRLATAQRARKRRQTTNLHAAAGNARRDRLHKLSARIVKDHDFIVVGDVSPSQLGKTRMAKSIYDASWSAFRNMLRYKSIATGATYQEVPERFTTQACSDCGALPHSSPKGIAGLRIREWTCGDCGSVHDRDVNAARNILRLGRQAPVEGAAV